MRTRTLDVHDDAVVTRMLHIRDACLSATRHRPRAVSWQEFSGALRFEDAGERAEYAGAFDDAGLLVGYAVMWFPLNDNRDKCWADVLVHPDHWRRGAGTALVRWMDGRAVQGGRRQILVESHVPAGGDERRVRDFAASTGFVLTNTELGREVDLPVEAATLDSVEAQRRWDADYDIEVHLDGVPDHRVPSFCHAYNRLGTDAPTGTVDFEPETLDAPRYARELEHELSLGSHRLTALAVHRASGTVAAYSDLTMPAGDPAFVRQGGTLVLAEHRGHRLGLAVKVANLRAVAQRFPERRFVLTSNAETNAWMVAINDALGFRVVERELDWAKAVHLTS